MWRNIPHQPHDRAPETRRLNSNQIASESRRGTAQAGSIDESVASMNPTASTSATIATTGKTNRQKRRRTSSSSSAGVAQPAKKVRRRKSTFGQPKKRPPKKQAAEFWEIKDIVDEKVENGNTLYLVDWVALDVNGQPYPKEWVTEVTELALAAWQARQGEQVADKDSQKANDSVNSLAEEVEHAEEEASEGTRLQDSEDDHSSVDAPSRFPARKSRESRRQVVLDSQDTEELLSDNQAAAHLGRQDFPAPRPAELIVEIRQPLDFDASTYLAIGADQGSQEASVTGSQGDDSRSHPVPLPIQDNRVIPDSQEPSTFTTSGSASGHNLHADHEIQTEIPRTPPDTATAEEGLENTADIPSHQPDWASGNQSPGPALAEPSAEPPSPQPPVADSQISLYQQSQINGPVHSFHFQTQVSFNSQSIISSLSSSQAGPTPTHDNERLTGSHISLRSSQSQGVSVLSLLIEHSQSEAGEPSSQAAQIVPHSLGHSEDIPSQSLDSGNRSRDRDNEIIPESSRRERVQRERGSQGSSQAPIAYAPHGTKPISSVPPLCGALGGQPEVAQLPPSAFTAYEGAATTPQKLPPLRDTSTFQTQISNLTRHSCPSATPATQIKDADMADEKPLSVRERLAAIRMARMTGTPEAHSSKLSEQDAGDGLPEVAPLAEEALHSEQPLSISPALLGPATSLEMEFEEHASSSIFENKLDDITAMSEPVFEDGAVNSAYEPLSEEQPATLDPSALTLSIEHDMMEPENEDDDASPSLHTDDRQPSSDHPGMAQEPEEVVHQPDQPAIVEPNILPYIDPHPNEFIVTLPLASNIRPQYVEMIKEANNDLAAYNAAFNIPPYRPPGPALIAKVDTLFNRLLDICDMPPSLEALRKMNPEQIIRYITATNSKYAFVERFINILDEESTVPQDVLILVRPGPAMALLEGLLSSRTGEDFKLDFQPQDHSLKTFGVGQTIITLQATSDKSYQVNPHIGVVIGFDHTFRRNLMPTAERPPVTLLLVTATSLQHINMRISEKIEPLGRKNYLLLALCASTQEMLEPEQGYQEAHELALLLAKYVIDPDDDNFFYEHQEPPHSIFERIIASSQLEAAQSSLQPNGSVERATSRKRSLDDVDNVETEVKRPRIAQPAMAATSTARTQLPESLRAFIGNDSVDPGSVIQVSVAKAEELAAKMAKLEAELAATRTQRDQYRDIADRSKREVDSWTASMNKIQPRYMAALRDRGIANKERQVELNKHAETTRRLASVQLELDTANTAVSNLREKLTEAQDALLGNGNVDFAKMALVEKELESARAKVSESEKRASVAQKDREYALNEYQNASHSAVELKKENDELQQRVIELKRQANDNIVTINQTQQLNEVRELTRLLNEQRTIVKDREADLNRAREQLATLKNGRRETRQSSVPQSPRLGVSSPRGPSRRAATEVASGAASRGASPSATGTLEASGNMPAIGSLFAGQQQGNGRFAHLRD